MNETQSRPTLTSRTRTSSTSRRRTRAPRAQAGERRRPGQRISAVARNAPVHFCHVSRTGARRRRGDGRRLDHRRAAGARDETGWDPASAEYVVGTSAGSMMGGLLASGVPPWFMVAHSARRDVRGPRGRRRPAGGHRRPRRGRDASGSQARSPPIGPGSPGADRPQRSARPHRHRSTALLAGWLPRGFISTEPLKDTIRRVVPAADGPSTRTSGSWRATTPPAAASPFGRDDAPPAELADAVAASCAIPGFYHPVTIWRPPLRGRRPVVHLEPRHPPQRGARPRRSASTRPRRSTRRSRGTRPSGSRARCARSPGAGSAARPRSCARTGTEVVLIQPTTEDHAVDGPEPDGHAQPQPGDPDRDPHRRRAAAPAAGVAELLADLPPGKTVQASSARPGRRRAGPRTCSCAGRGAAAPDAPRAQARSGRGISQCMPDDAQSTEVERSRARARHTRNGSVPAHQRPGVIAGARAAARPTSSQQRIPTADLDERDPDYIRENLPGPWLLASLYFRADVRGPREDPARPGRSCSWATTRAGTSRPTRTVFTLAFATYFGVERRFFQLAHNLVLAMPGLGLLRKYGTVAASPKNAQLALDRARRCSSTQAATTRCTARSWESGKVDFGGRKGLIRLALEKDVPIVPVVSLGGQETALFLCARRVALEAAAARQDAPPEGAADLARAAVGAEHRRHGGPHPAAGEDPDPRARPGAPTRGVRRGARTSTPSTTTSWARMQVVARPHAP